MNRFARSLRIIPAFLPALLVYLFLVPLLWAGPPLPDDYTPDEDEGYESLLDEGMLSFGEDYVDLIDELESVLEEFDDFFEEFGQVSLNEYEKAIKKLRRTIDEKYSAESYEEMMLALDELLLEFAELETELEESGSKKQRRRLRNLRALEEDLEDIREQLDDEVGDASLYSQLDAETLAEIISRAFEDAQDALVEAKKLYEEKKVSGYFELPEMPEVPEVPPLHDHKRSLVIKGHELRDRGYFTESMTQMGNTSIDNNEITIQLENALGSIEAETWNRSEVHAELTIGYSESSKKSLSLAKEIKLAVLDSPEMIKFVVQYPDDDNETISIVSSHLNVTLPRSNPVNIKNSFGSVAVEGLDGDLDIVSNFSSMDIQHISGNVTIVNSSGVVYVEDIGGRLDATNSFAPIEAVFVNGGAKITNSYAPIIVEKSSGHLEINTSGDVNVDRHDGNANIRSGNGRMEIFAITGDLVAVNSFGQMIVEKIGGDAKIENANASIEISGIGGLLTVSNNFAPITIDGVGNNVVVRSSNGDVIIENTKSGVDVINRFGEVTIKSVVGPVNVSNASEAVYISNVQSLVTVRNQFSPVILSTILGDVEVDNMNASVDLSDIRGSARVNTTFGLVSCDNIGGPFIIGNDNGSVELISMMEINDDCEVKTTFGDIIVELMGGKRYNLIATTSFGDIVSDLPMDVTSSGSVTTGKHVAGKSNPTIKLTGNNSSIKITTE